MAFQTFALLLLTACVTATFAAKFYPGRRYGHITIYEKGRYDNVRRVHPHSFQQGGVPLKWGGNVFAPEFNTIRFPPSRGSKRRPSIKPLSPFEGFTEDELKSFYASLAKISNHKKPTKLVKYSLSEVDGKLKSSLKGAKKCCGNEWAAVVGKPVPLVVPVPVVPLQHTLVPLQYDEPVPSNQHNPTDQFYGYRNSDDVKPVVEHIEDDLKYDFRTKTHSF